MPGSVAIVGRPNVGKSALFNRIVGRRLAIVHDQPGVTRDRITAPAEWNGTSFTAVDTGGIGLVRGEKSTDVIVRAALDQVELAIEAAQVIVLVVNVQEGLVALDSEVAARLRQSGKPILLAINKVDHPRAEGGIDDFAALGISKIFPLTAIHGFGIEALMDQIVATLPKEEPREARSASNDPEAEGECSETQAALVDGIKIAIVGRPNVGKSSLVNALTKSKRLIVSPIPGTTRDAVDVPFELDTEGHREKYVLIDTAGIRKQRRVDDSVEFFSVKRTEDSIRRADLVVLMLDAADGIMEQDKKIAAKITEEHKPCILVINKWDLVQEEVLEARKKEIKKREAKKTQNRDTRSLSTLSEFAEWVQEKLFFLDYAPVIFTSAQSGFHLDRLLEAVRYVGSQLKVQIPTALLNRTLTDAIEARQPVSTHGLRLKFFYATQVQKVPPTFVLFVNRIDLFTDHYRKYLTQRLRQAFGYEGCPIVLFPRARPRTIEPKRRDRDQVRSRNTRSKK